MQSVRVVRKVCVRDSGLMPAITHCANGGEGMLVLLSPAKSINTDDEHTTVSSSTPGFDIDTVELLQTLQSYSKAVLQQTLGVSPALARQVPRHLVFRCQAKHNFFGAYAA